MWVFSSNPEHEALNHAIEWGVVFSDPPNGAGRECGATIRELWLMILCLYILHMYTVYVSVYIYILYVYISIYIYTCSTCLVTTYSRI